MPSCHDLAPIFHFPPPPQVITTTPSPPVTQPAHAQQAPVQCQSPASIPLPPSPPPMDICPPSPPCPTLTHIMPQSDVPNLVDTYMHTAPSSPKAKYLWEAFNHAKEYASEAQDRTPPLLPMDAEFIDKLHHRKACDSPATPITPATHQPLRIQSWSHGTCHNCHCHWRKQLEKAQYGKLPCLRMLTAPHPHHQIIMLPHLEDIIYQEV